MAAQLSLARLLRERASDDQRQVLTVAVALAQQLDYPIYLVGGATRDLLLTGEMHDLDLVVEGDGRRFGGELAERLGAEIRLHDRFQTAEIAAGGLRVDVATARREVYPEPASLPVTQAGSLEEDLARRDFTVNAIALRLWPEAQQCFDPFDGRRDLDDRQLRVLHDRSFIDDPTRLLRAARLAARLRFRLEAGTEALAREAVKSGAFEPLTGGRFRQELILLLEEEESVDRATELLADLAVWSVLHPQLTLEPPVFERLRSVTRLRREWELGSRQRPAVQWWYVRLMVLTKASEPATREAIAERLDLAAPARLQLGQLGGRLRRAKQALGEAEISPHEVDRICRALSPEDLACLTVSCGSQVSTRIDLWLDELRHIRLAIGGRDLLARGFPAGPAIGRALAATLEARLDGSIQKEQELDFAVRRLSETSPDSRLKGRGA